MDGPDVRDHDEAHELRQQAMPDNLKDTIRPEIEALISEIAISEEDRKALRESIVEHFNKAVNIPIIGERLEAILFSFAVKVLERLVLAFTGQLRDRILRAID
jgi:hypothetical protein